MFWELLALTMLAGSGSQSSAALEAAEESKALALVNNTGEAISCIHLVHYYKYGDWFGEKKTVCGSEAQLNSAKAVEERWEDGLKLDNDRAIEANRPKTFWDWVVHIACGVSLFIAWLFFGTQTTTQYGRKGLGGFY